MAKYRFAFCLICDPERRKGIRFPEDRREVHCPRCGQGLKPDPAWWIEYYFEGRRKREKIGPSRVLADQVLAKRRVEIVENKYLDIRKEPKIRFEDFADEYLEVHCKPNNRSWQKTDSPNLAHLKKYFGGKYLCEITPQDIERYRAARLKKVTKATINRVLTTLSSLFNRAIEWGKGEKNPMAKIKTFKLANQRVRYLEKEEINKLLAEIDRLTLANKHDQYTHLKPIVIVALHTGMRRGEILGLKWHDIDINRDIIHLYNTKNGEKREVPMNEIVRKTIIAVPKNPKSPYIFCGKNGEPYGSIKKSFSTACEKAGIINFRFHDLRHTFASQLVMSGVDLNTVRELLGHKSIDMTLRYSHLSPDHKKRAVDVLGQRMDTFVVMEDKSKMLEELNILELSENKSAV